MSDRTVSDIPPFSRRACSPLFPRRESPAYPTDRRASPPDTLNAKTRRTARAFTLVELMVSVAIAVIIILGIEQVFSISSKTIGAGQSLSKIMSDDRGAQATITADLTNADIGSDCPAFLIRSMRTYAFESASDKASASNPADPSKDPNFAAMNSGTIPVTFYNYRNHRVDRLAFFARGFYSRQTGGTDSNPQFISPTTSNEAYIWYGHVAQPNNAYVKSAGASGNYYEPGDTNTANDNNAYASDWILGRVAMVLDPIATADGSYIGAGAPLGPLSLSSQSADGKSLYQSRYDQALTSISSYNQTLASGYAATGSSPYILWAGGGGANWFTALLGSPPTGSPSFSGRFQANPFPIKDPVHGLTNAALAKTFPIFVRGCTQFMVEYAGNFYTKTSTTDPTPLMTNGASPPDPTGQLDFQVVNGIKQVRWYGFPRHTSGPGSSSIYATTDVVPLGLFLNASGVSPRPTFERYYPNGWPSTPTLTTDISTASLPANAEYVAAWGPDTTEPLPKMIRITLAMDDPSGNLTTPQTFEYVINLQP